MKTKPSETPTPTPQKSPPGVLLPGYGSPRCVRPKHGDDCQSGNFARSISLGTRFALLFCCLTLLQSLHAAPAAFPMQPGEVATTYYSGSSPSGFNVEVIDVRPPYGPLGANWLAPMFHNEFPLTANTWKASNLGEVFGICLDNASPPNIYVAATIIYGNGAGSFGVAGAGGVYKLDGNSGAIATFATLPADSLSSLGNICFDAANKQFFVSHLGNGLIYRLNTAGGVLSTYDHGVTGRANVPLTTIPDNNQPGLTAAGRRVWGLQVYNNRLYYSVWYASATASEIWSVGVAGGPFTTSGANGPKLEFSIPMLSGTSYPVTDIAFSKSGKMLLAERTCYANGNTYYQSAHQSRALEYKLVGANWVPSGNNYYVGDFSHYNSAGGVDYDCKENAFVTGDALIYNYPVFLYGLQIIPAGGNTPATAISTSYLIDMDGDTSSSDKTYLGDVVDYRENCDCLAIGNQSLNCIATNNTYAWSFCVTNGFNGPIGYLSFPDLPAGVTIEHDIIQLNPALQQGQSTCLTLYLTNAIGGTNLCFTIGAHSTNFFQCCSISNCLAFTPCCAYVASEAVTPIKGPPANCYNYYLTIKNVSQEPVSYFFLTPDPFNSCITFSPDVLHLNTPLLPGQTSSLLGPVKVCIDPTCPKPLYYMLSLHSSNLTECCSIRRRLPLPSALPIIIGNPTDGASFLEGANIALAVGLSGDIAFTSVNYLANGQVVAASAAPPFAAVWSNAPVGQFELRAVGAEANGGGQWISDPATISVYAASPPSIVAGSFWKYLDNGSDQGSAWRSPSFDDSLWAFGQALLGYGNGNEATVINGGPATNRNVTTYFRSQFFVAAPTSVTNLTIRLLRDDGGIVYLNGTEVFRSNMPTGAVTYATLAAGPTDGTNETQFFSTSVSPSLLVAGENTVAVEIHQVNRTNDDMSFDLALAANTSAVGLPAAPALTSLSCVNNALTFCLPTTAGANYHVEYSDSLTSANWTVLRSFTGDGTIITVTNAVTAAPQGFYRVRVDQ